jgi:hypothetical protein
MKSEKSFLKGRWNYHAIKQSDTTFIQVTSDDYMLLNEDGSFEYHIASNKKDAAGTWTYDNDMLTLNYENPPINRKFIVEILSKYKLLMREGEIVFDYDKDFPHK